MLHFFTAVFFAVLVVLLAWPGHVIATLCVFAVAFLFMACLVELLRHHVQVLVRQLDPPAAKHGDARQ